MPAQQRKMDGSDPSHGLRDDQSNASESTGDEIAATRVEAPASRPRFRRSERHAFEAFGVTDSASVGDGAVSRPCFIVLKIKKIAPRLDKLKAIVYKLNTLVYVM